MAPITRGSEPTAALAATVSRLEGRVAELVRLVGEQNARLQAQDARAQEQGAVLERILAAVERPPPPPPAAPVPQRGKTADAGCQTDSCQSDAARSQPAPAKYPRPAAAPRQPGCTPAYRDIVCSRRARASRSPASLAPADRPTFASIAASPGYSPPSLLALSSLTPAESGPEGLLLEKCDVPATSVELQTAPANRCSTTDPEDRTERQDIPSDKTSVATIQSNWRKNLEDQVALACYVENEDGEPGELVAFNLCVVRSKDDPEEDLDKVEGDSWRKLFKTLILAEKTCDVFQKYGIDQYLSSSGLTVLPEHRGQNIGAEMFKAREPLCRALGLQATATVFTAKTSQVLAAKCGYELLGELQYDTMLLHGIDLGDCNTPSAKYMGIKYE